MTRLIRVGILGMGQIAVGFDSIERPEVRTHVKAILSDKRLVLTHVADRDPERAAREAKRFVLNATVTTPDDIVTADLDGLCITTPDGTHIDYLERAIAGPARAILVEKPLEGGAARRAAALQALSNRGGALVIHHLRRWIPGLSDWITQARAGDFGRPLSVVVQYGRGFRHSGIHALDLIAAFIGTTVKTAVPIGEAFADYSDDDRTLSLGVVLATEAGDVPLTMLGVDGRVQTVFSVDLRFERARIVIFDEAGIRAELHRPAKVDYIGYAPELRPVLHFHDNPPKLLASVWRNIADYLDEEVPLACSGEAGLAGYDLADAILKHLQV